MSSRLTQFAMKLSSRLSTAVNQLFRRSLERAQPNPVTGTLADFPRSRSELLADAGVPCYANS